MTSRQTICAWARRKRWTVAWSTPKALTTSVAIPMSTSLNGGNAAQGAVVGLPGVGGAPADEDGPPCSSRERRRRDRWASPAWEGGRGERDSGWFLSSVRVDCWLVWSLNQHSYLAPRVALAGLCWGNSNMNRPYLAVPRRGALAGRGNEQAVPRRWPSSPHDEHVPNHSRSRTAPAWIEGRLGRKTDLASANMNSRAAACSHGHRFRTSPANSTAVCHLCRSAPLPAPSIHGARARLLPPHSSSSGLALSSRTLMAAFQPASLP
jgi:hypothetical protein